jgi:hypothetical protein
MWDLWWTKWHWGGFSPRPSVSPVSSHSTKCSLLINLPGAGTTGQSETDILSGISLTPPQEIKKNKITYVCNDTSVLNVGMNLDELARVTTVNTCKITRYYEPYNLHTNLLKSNFLLFQMKHSKVVCNLTAVRNNKDIKEEHSINFCYC